jgi:putative restriction endonuclease
MPSLTVPKLLTKEELFDKILTSIQNSDRNVIVLSKSFPLRIIVSDGATQEKLVIYIWNISQGGKTRNPNEYRIQMKGRSLIVGDDFKTILFGWFDSEQIFVAFNAYKHQTFGYSPSVQVPKQTIDEAANKGIATHTKKLNIIRGQEIVIAFKPEFIIEYIDTLFPQYHAERLMSIERAEANVLANPLQVSDADLMRLSAPRRKVIINVLKNLREKKFQEYIWKLYQGRCAICGLNAHLTEAAHIVPVGKRGTDELVNGILLCRNHHKAYDSGILAINKHYRIILNTNKVSELRSNREDSMLDEFIRDSRIGEKIAMPTDSRFNPKKEYLISNCKSKGF